MQLGRFVKKGAKGIMIFAPIVRNQEDLSKEETSNVTLGFRAVYVFDQADTDGKPLAELASAEGDPSDYTERLRQFVTERGVQLEYSDSIYPAQGQCTAEKITLLPGQSAAEEFISLPTRWRIASFTSRSDAAKRPSVSARLRPRLLLS
jgi:hypothetical protein